jgi:hypothetical protein
LEKSKTYQYDLDGNGSKEKIQYTAKLHSTDNKREKCKFDVDITVNGKSFYNKTLTGEWSKYWEDEVVWSLIPVKILITDTDMSDKQMELLVIEGSGLDDYWLSEMKNIRYYRYQSGKMTYMQNLATLLKSDFESNYYSLHGMSDEEGKFLELDGKGHLSADLCLQFSDFDYKHCTRTLTLKDGKFSVNTSSSLTCLEPEYNDYKVQKSMKIYTTAGGKTVAATLKKGKKVYVTGIYKNSKGKLYFKVKYEGKTGYMDSSILMKNAEMLGCLHA